MTLRTHTLELIIWPDKVSGSQIDWTSIARSSLLAKICGDVPPPLVGVLRAGEFLGFDYWT